MDSPNSLDSLENYQAKELEQSRLSCTSHRKNRNSPLRSRKRDGKFHDDSESLPVDRARTRTRELSLEPDQDRDRLSDGDSASFHSDDYENVSVSPRSLSPSSLSPRSGSPSPRRGERPRRVASSPLQRPGVHKGASRHPGPQAPPHHPRPAGLRAQSLGREAPPKGVSAPPKGVDAVAKRAVGALRISELRNALAELRLHADVLQRENRLLRQLQLRQERALQRNGDAEGEVAQLVARHANETRSLRERLRRGRERERAAEHAYREADAHLQRCRARLQKLQQLVDAQHLGEREELESKLSLMQSRAQESDRRVKELEKNMELNNGSFQRQLASERRRTHDALQEVQAQREEVDRLCVKLKREKELDARNIYANRMLRRVPKKESQNPTKRKDPSRSSSKAVQTEERMLSQELPTPPPAVTDGTESPSDGQANDYLSLKEPQSSEQNRKDAEVWKILEMDRVREKEKVQEKDMDNTSEQERERNGERQRRKEMHKEVKKVKDDDRVDHQDFNWNEGISERNGWGRENEDRKRWSQNQNEEEKRKFLKQVEEDKWKREHELQANQEEERQRKEQLLAKMREIDMQTQGQDSDLFSGEMGSIHSPPQFSLSRNQNVSAFTEPHEGPSTPEGGKGGGGLGAQRANQDIHLAFGSYAPSFGKPNPREGPGLRNPSYMSGHLPGERDSGMDLSGLVKEKKSNLMQQLFGSGVSSPLPDPSGNVELLSSPSAAKPLAGVLSGRRRDTETPYGDPCNNRSTLHVSESHLAVRAIMSFDDDIEEVTL